MDRTAIEAIAELASSAANRATTDIPITIMPGGNKIESLERYFVSPSRQRVSLKTERLEDFCRYVSSERSDEDNTTVFVKPDGSGALAVIDFGDHENPRWADHKIRLEMQHTPAFAAALCATNVNHTQRSVTDWVEDWAHIITPANDSGDMTIAKAIAAIRRVEIKQTSAKDHEEGDFRAKTSGFAEIEAKSKAGALPGWFDVACQVYPCTKQRTIRLRLSLRTGENEPRFALRIMGKDKLMQEVAEEIELEITQRLNGTQVYVAELA